MRNETKKGTNIIFSQNEENRKNYLFSENEKGLIYSSLRLTHADASFCRKGHLMMPLFPKQSIERQLLFQKTRWSHEDISTD